LDASGNIYGTTQWGGDTTGVNGGEGSGTVFKLTPTADGWTETILHNFGHDKDGAIPHAPVAFGSNANLYGTTTSGGLYRSGTVYEVTP
jgi:hypothetical protein